MSPDEPVGAGFFVQTSGKPIEGKLVARGVVIGPGGLRRDRIEIPSSAVDLLAGATVVMRVLGLAAKGVIVPSRALVRTGEDIIVFVQTSPGVFMPRQVTVAATDETNAVITKGVAASEVVVTKGSNGLRGEMLRAELRHMD